MSERQGIGLAAREVRAIFGLGLPIIVNNLAISLTSFVDVVMAGRLGATELAAVGVGNAVWAAFMLPGLGVLMAVSPTVAHRVGARETSVVGAYTRQSVWLAWLLALLMMTAMAAVALRGLVVIGIDAQIVPATQGYLLAISLGLPGLFSYLCLRFTSEGIGHTAPIMFVAVASLAVNVFGNYVLMFGNLGFPAMGATGCGLASAISMWFSLAAMLVYTRYRQRIYQPLGLFARFDWPQPAKLRELLSLGLPIGGSVFAEVGLFSAVGIIMGVIGANEAAAHAVAINYAATMFMIPLALHSATTVRVGQALGAGDAPRARLTGWSGIVVCGAIMTVSALLLVVFREPITALYTNDPEVREIAVGLLLVALIFQISDGIQVGAAGALRGYKDTRVPMWLNVVAYWGVGFPVAWLLGIVLDYGPRGVWTGLAAGLTVAALLLSMRFWRVTRFVPAAASAPQS